MFTKDDLLGKLREIGTLIHDYTNPDGTFRFDSKNVMISLELARRMILQENDE